jgi:isocitrate dehydrogenase kinase/phosphatase
VAWVLAKQIAQAILKGFERHYALFSQITAGAKSRFENAQWQTAQEASRKRIYFYDERVEETLSHLRRTFRISELDEVLWQRIKVEYVRLLNQHKQAELAETFYNSIFCHMFHRKYFNNRNIFVRPAVSTDYIETEVPTYRSYYPKRDGFDRVTTKILEDFGFDLPFANLRRDVRNVLRAIRERIPADFHTYQSFYLAVLSHPFYRNKAAYIIGKVVNGPEETPFAIPVLNDEQGGLYVDTLLLDEGEIANVFSFARAYFMVETDAPSAEVNFLLRLLPSKSRADLYTYIGLHKQGKTEFYRDFLHHLRHSSDKFVIAPGIKGMVMSVFTLPSFPYVFKVIKDRFRAPKDLTREVVKQKYQLVKNHDRVGRMADSWEYSEAAFPIGRFSESLLEELCKDASGNIELEGEQIVIKHLYIERRMNPLNVYLENADDERIREAIDEYGQAIKQLAAANIFPGDMLFKNFGVTRQGRVVFYDYDELCYLTECNFREIPPAPLPEYELSDEPWYPVGPNDIFPEEFERFLLTDPKVKKIFKELHGDLLDPEYWRTRQEKILAGQMEDVFPYPESQRFEHRYPERSDETLVEPPARLAR